MDAFKEIYVADISVALVPMVSERVIDQVHDWQDHPVDPIYLIVYLDCIVLKIRQDKRVFNKSLFLALGINMEEQLGLWLPETEGVKLWLSVLTELKNSGLQDTMIACVDGLKGFPDTTEEEYLQTQIQRCIVHMVCKSPRNVPWKDYRAVIANLKQIDQSASEHGARKVLAAFGECFDSQYPKIICSWHNHWDNLITLFELAPAIQKVIYTTNAIETLNNVIRQNHKASQAVPQRRLDTESSLPGDVAGFKEMDDANPYSKSVLIRSIIEFGGRLDGHL